VGGSLNSDQLDQFIEKWKASGASERSNSQPFLLELCETLEMPRPDPRGPDPSQDAYVFERDVTFLHSDGRTSSGRIDLYKRGSFVLESKQAAGATHQAALPGLAPARPRTGAARRNTPGWETAMERARGQAEQYLRALPPEEGRPPFIIVVDVGHSLELFSEFSCSGGQYVPFPDPTSYRVFLDDLRQPEIRERLRLVWTDPLALDPSRRSARVTREIAEHLAALARSLEAAGNRPSDVADFLMRCLFTMFAEDVGLLERAAFTKMLDGLKDHPEHFKAKAEDLWRAMKGGGYCIAIDAMVRHFNGYLFAEPWALDLDREQLALLMEAARADWRDVEPAIFGTLLERALDPRERHQLGAHYTPRAYVERLVMPTVMEPLREEWEAAKAAAMTLHIQGKDAEAFRELEGFHRRLCRTRVLDPACGSGNFLYVCLEHMKRLEGEVLEVMEELSHRQESLELPIERSINPQQFLGLELNPRAAAITELVLWLGYLQWHFRTRTGGAPPEPIIRDFTNIERRDAVLAHDGERPLLDSDLRPVTRWDGRTYAASPTTGEPVPDETARVQVWEYVNPRKATWPEADFVVGNPPFMGIANMRAALGDGYAETIREVYKEIPGSCDYVLYWWDRAADLAREGKIRRFGFIATNSMRQTLNRRVLERHLAAKKPLSIIFAIPDHPWVDAADGAAVRIAMAVGEGGDARGRLCAVAEEKPGDERGMAVSLTCREGKIWSNLTIGPDLAAAVPLRANGEICCPGVKLHGSGFIVTPDQARELGLGRIQGLERHIRDYRNGRDIAHAPRGVMVIDLFGLRAGDVRQRFPEVYQWVLERVKPERDQNRDPKPKRYWWLHGRPREELRSALSGLPRYIATVETSKHRFFVFLEQSILPDNMLVAVALDDAYFLGVLSSRVHVAWALAMGGRLGVGNDPRYNKSRCFETFPFPDPPDALRERIRDLGERLDAHRKRQQKQHPRLTMTGMYNVLAKLRAGEELGEREREINQQGLVSLLKQIHDELDAAVCRAYGWPADITEDEVLARLVELNRERAGEEAEGLVRWLRPEYQAPDAPAMAARELGLERPAAAPARVEPMTWPREMAAQAKAVRRALSALGAPADAETVAKCFKRAPRARVSELLETMVTLGKARKVDGQHYETA